jgi:hypothetical protein
MKWYPTMLHSLYKYSQTGDETRDWRVKLGTQRQGDFTDNSINKDKDLANLLN